MTRQILTLNAGGASLKVALFGSATERQVDWSQQKTQDVHNHTEALHKLLGDLDLTSVSAVGHRVVHGGMAFRQRGRREKVLG
jgi:acetate kinase